MHQIAAIDGGSAAVIAAVLALAGSVITAVLAQSTRRHVGTSNGQGSVVTMLESLLDGQREQARDIADIRVRLTKGDMRMDRLEDSQITAEAVLAAICGRLGCDEKQIST